MGDARLLVKLNVAVRRRGLATLAAGLGPRKQRQQGVPILLHNGDDHGNDVVLLARITTLGGGDREEGDKSQWGGGW